MPSEFAWPDGKRCAVSLSFDDARDSQITNGLPILSSLGILATFYVSLPEITRSPSAWRTAIARGHEVGNHTVNHPCSGNYVWCRNHLEDYTLARMEKELTDAQKSIQAAVGVVPTTFAYPCGNKFVGRGSDTQSYVPLISRHFLAGRGFRDETPNNPATCDLAQLAGVDADRHSFDVLKTWIDRTMERGGWLCFVSHDVSDTLPQAIALSTLTQVCEYLHSQPNVWTDTIAKVAQHLADFGELSRAAQSKRHR